MSLANYNHSLVCMWGVEIKHEDKTPEIKAEGAKDVHILAEQMR